MRFLSPCTIRGWGPALSAGGRDMQSGHWAFTSVTKTVVGKGERSTFPRAWGPTSPAHMSSMVANSSASPGQSYPAAPLGYMCVCTHMSLGPILICGLWGWGGLYGFGNSASWVLFWGVGSSSLNSPGLHRQMRGRMSGDVRQDIILN